MNRILRWLTGQGEVRTKGVLVSTTSPEADDRDLVRSSVPEKHAREEELLAAEYLFRTRAQQLQVIWLGHPSLEAQEAYAAALMAWAIFTRNEEADRYAGQLATSALELRHGIKTPLTPRIDTRREVWPTAYGPPIEDEDVNGCPFVSRTCHDVPPGRFQEDEIRDLA